MKVKISNYLMRSKIAENVFDFQIEDFPNSQFEISDKCYKYLEKLTRLKTYGISEGFISYLINKKFSNNEKWEIDRY